MTINMLGIDIAKNTFQLPGADSLGKAVHKKRLARRELAAHVANLPACTIVMEACGGANYWARVFQGSGRIGQQKCTDHLQAREYLAPNLIHQRRIASRITIIPRSASRSSISR